MSILITSLLCFSALSCRAQKVDNSPVASLDLDRYLGTWYEIARYDHSFERGLTHAKAHYSLNTDGTVTVTNSGFKNGKFKVAHGKAKKTDTAGLLRVSFFGPFYSDYRVMLLGESYDYALVGSGSSKYLWILSRSQTLPDDIIKNILLAASDRGYGTDSLIWVEHLPVTE